MNKWMNESVCGWELCTFSSAILNFGNYSLYENWPLNVNYLWSHLWNCDVDIWHVISLVVRFRCINGEYRPPFRFHHRLVATGCHNTQCSMLLTSQQLSWFCWQTGRCASYINLRNFYLFVNECSRCAVNEWHRRDVESKYKRCNVHLYTCEFIACTVHTHQYTMYHVCVCVHACAYIWAPVWQKDRTCRSIVQTW